ncbi:hypothetical protein MC885_014197 [Smutsia gigantea]|nr:hypothetical protein MC885_014197 [Smutsia gigantea]
MNACLASRAAAVRHTALRWRAGHSHHESRLAWCSVFRQIFREPDDYEVLRAEAEQASRTPLGTSSNHSASTRGGAAPLRLPETGRQDRKWPSLVPLFTWCRREVTRVARELQTRRPSEPEKRTPLGLRDR